MFVVIWGVFHVIVVVLGGFHYLWWFSVVFTVCANCWVFSNVFGGLWWF